MTVLLESLADVADQFDAIVLDQWGVLHDGAAPYPGAVAAVSRLASAGTRLAVLSNSGKRAGPNLDRIEGIGFNANDFELVMTSGEALWQDMAAGRVAAKTLFPILRGAGDAEVWADGLDVQLSDDLSQADAVLLMGLPDEGPAGAAEVLAEAQGLGLPILCTNPDRTSPRAGGALVISPGALAHDLQDKGADVRFYGKPHAPVFRAIETAMGLTADRLLMVGDSFEHDIDGGASAGWSTAFVRGGIHATDFDCADPLDRLAALVGKTGHAAPTFTLSQLS